MIPREHSRMRQCGFSSRMLRYTRTSAGAASMVEINSRCETLEDNLLSESRRSLNNSR